MAENVHPSKLEHLQANSLPALPGDGRAYLEGEAPRSVTVDPFVELCEDEAHLCEAVTQFLVEGLRAGERVTVIATAPRRQAFEGRLAAEGLDVERLRGAGRLVAVDARELLAVLVQDGELDPARFRAAVGALLGGPSAAGEAGPARAYGELADVLWGEGKRTAALLVEELWRELSCELPQGQPPAPRLAWSMAGFYKELGSKLGGELGNNDARAAEPPPADAHRLARELARRDEVERALRESLRELRLREAALRGRERQLQSITDALPVLVAFLDTERRYRFVSAAYERWFKVPPAEILGKHIEELVGRPVYEAVREHMDRALAGERVSYEAELPYPGGVIRTVSATYVPQLGDRGQVTGFVAFVDDITERKGFERYRAAAAVRSERLLQITSALAEAVTPAEVFEAIVDHVRVAVGASTTGLWLVDDDGRTARLVRSFGYPEAASQALAAVPLDAHPSIPALEAIRSGEPVWIPSQEALLRAYPHLALTVRLGRSYRVASLPLISKDRTLGALAISIDDGQDALEEERSFLLLVARYAGQAIERLRLLEAERKSRAEADAAAARMGVLSHASRVFVEANLHLAARIEGIVRELGTALGSSVAISLLEGDGRLHPTAPYHPVPEAHALLRALVAEAPVRFGEGITGTVAQTGQSVLVPAIDPAAVATRAAPAYRAFVELFPVHAFMCVPLRVRGRLIGVVSASRVRAGETYTPADLELLEALADRAAAAIENTRLHQENVEARGRAEQLYRFAHAAVSAERVEQVFEAALDALEGALGADRAAILMLDDEGVMRFRAWRRLSDELRRVLEGHSPWPPDAAAPQPILALELERDTALGAHLPQLHAEGIASLACLPLVTRGRLRGMFLVGHARPHTSSTSELELASAIANHLASTASRFSAVAELERTIHYNELFSGILAHDLRNPLGAITNAAQLLLMQQEGEGNRSAKPLSRILSSSQRMSRMIAQLLDLTRARTGGGIELQPREVSLADLCDQAIGELELVYPERAIERDYAGDASGVWDPDRLLQIISNLVANAGEHAVAGSGISVRIDGRHPEAVSLEVHNEGAIPPGLLSHLFDPFSGSRPRRSGSRGLGLGLFIVQEMVRSHRGTVSVTSSEAHGTTFTVRLPRRAHSSPQKG